jgi:serine/tyrosine/threonine adenylyltransferase
MPFSASYRPAPHIQELGDGFYDQVSAARFPRHILRFRHQRAAREVGLGELSDAEWEEHLARFDPLPDNLAKPLALRYHGHQFDVYNPDLGDGRGFLFAQMEDERGRLMDLGTKGSGQTPWSRGGDGRLTLKGGVREVLATEMLEALGVTTSRSFSLFETGEPLMRGDEPSPTRSSVLVRLSHSHIRFGTFQRLAHLGDTPRTEKLLDYTLARYFPGIETGPRKVHDFLVEVTKRTAALSASFMVAGFVHGVLNSDNMNVTGESFDYGPYRFLPEYDPDFTAAYFDHSGLYAYGRQPEAMMRNVVRLAGACKPLAPALDVGAALAGYEAVLHDETTRRLLARLGLRPRDDSDENDELGAAVFAFLDASGMGYDRFFFDVYGGGARQGWTKRPDAADLYAGAAWDALVERLRVYDPVSPVAPRYYEGKGPCTLVIDEVERVWDAIAARDDWGPFYEKVEEMREVPRPVMGDAEG